MPVTDPTPSPDVLDYIVGKGIVSFKPEGEEDYIDLGNAPKFSYATAVKKLEHFSSRRRRTQSRQPHPR
jgi:hypothetical protein